MGRGREEGGCSLKEVMFKKCQQIVSKFVQRKIKHNKTIISG